MLSWDTSQVLRAMLLTIYGYIRLLCLGMLHSKKLYLFTPHKKGKFNWEFIDSASPVLVVEADVGHAFHNSTPPSSWGELTDTDESHSSRPHVGYTRTRKMHAHLLDYDYNSVAKSTSYSTRNYVSHDRLSSSHKRYSLSLLTEHEPSSYD